MKWIKNNQNRIIGGLILVGWLIAINVVAFTTNDEFTRDFILNGECTLIFIFSLILGIFLLLS